MYLAYVVPLLVGKIIPWRIALHVFGQQDVGIIVKFDEGHNLPLVLRET